MKVTRDGNTSTMTLDIDAGDVGKLQRVTEFAATAGAFAEGEPADRVSQGEKVAGGMRYWLR